MTAAVRCGMLEICIAPKTFDCRVTWHQIYDFKGGCFAERVINMLNYTAYLCNPEGGPVSTGTLPEDAGTQTENRLCQKLSSVCRCFQIIFLDVNFVRTG